MSESFSILDVQPLPDGGILVRLKKRKLVLEHHVQQLAEELESLVARERLMLIDLTNVEYLSSIAIGVLLTTRRLLGNVAGGIALCGLQPRVADVFRICN